MLKICSDGRKAALDLELVGISAAGPARSTPSSATSPASTTQPGTWSLPGDSQRRREAGSRSCSATSAPQTRRAAGPGLRQDPRRARRRRGPGRADPVHPRRRHGPAEGRPIRRLPGREGRGAARLHRQARRRHQHPDPVRRPAPRRRPVASRRRGTTRRPRAAPRQPQSVGGDIPVRQRKIVRLIYVADPGKESQIHRPGPWRTTVRP